MTRAGTLIAVGLIVAVAAAAVPSPAVGQQQRHQLREGRGSDSSRPHDRPGLRRRQHAPRPFVTYYVPPPVVYDTYYTPPPVYYVPPVVYQAPPVSYPAPAMPRVIEYPTGRYELRGDGVSTPYEWAWIPNPPPEPPPPFEPPSVLPEPEVEPEAPARSREAFRWTDAGGVTTWTDRLDNVTEGYRAHVQRLR